MQLKFSPANAKTKALYAVPELQKFLDGKRKVYSLDLLSGYACPQAKDCLSKAVDNGGKRIIQDGPHTKFRCFSASQEVLLPVVYNLRKHNFDVLRQLSKMTRMQMANEINSQLPKNLGILRMHVAGDFFNITYFDAMALVARKNPDRLFYGYTKSLNFWVCRLGQLTDNFILTASRGGKLDDLIDEHNLRSVKVVYHPDEAEQMGLDIDHDDSHAARPSLRDQNFALLIHGTQPKGSIASAAKSYLKREGIKFSYKK